MYAFDVPLSIYFSFLVAMEFPTSSALSCTSGFTAPVVRQQNNKIKGKYLINYAGRCDYISIGCV